jgi:hypothetical protein
MPQEHYKTPRPEPSTPTGSAPPLPQASPPASAATGTQCLRFPPLARSLSPPVEPTRRPGQPLSTLALSRSVPEPQTKLTPPPHQAPPGQSSRRPPSPSRENNQTPRIRCHLNRANDTSTTHTHPVWTRTRSRHALTCFSTNPGTKRFLLGHRLKGVMKRLRVVTFAIWFVGVYQCPTVATGAWARYGRFRVRLSASVR